MYKELEQLRDDARRMLKKSSLPKGADLMLATLTEDYFDDPDWIYERKLDGERVLACVRNGKVSLLTRNDKQAHTSFPEIAEALSAHKLPDAAFDGEVVAFKGSVTSFSRLQRRMHVQDAAQARKSGVAVYYYVFDVLHLDGYDLTALPMSTRKRILRRVLEWSDPLRYTPHRREHGIAFYREACRKGWEGVIAKDANAQYEHGRSKKWLKFKCSTGQELVIGGFTEPQGTREGFGALLVGYFEDEKLRYAGKVGTGYDDETLRSLRDRMDDLEQQRSPFADAVDESGVHFIAPELVGEFAFTEWTDDGKLRHPRFIGLRDDKPAKEVVRESPQRQ